MIDKATLLAAISANVSRLRKHTGLSQEALAELTGINRITLSCIENGRMMPSSLLLYTLADALRVSADDLRRVSQQPAKIA